MAARSPSSVGRDELLAAATGEFADHGYAGATTAGIARRARVTQPLVHHHFGSKLGLWEAVLEQLFGRLQQQLGRAQAEAEGMDTRSRLAHLLRSFIRFSGAHPELSRLIRMESSSGGEAFEMLYERWLAPLIAFMAGEVRNAIDDGTMRDVDPAHAYFAVVGLCTEPFGVREIARRSFGLDLSTAEGVERYAEFAVELLLRGLGPSSLEARPASRSRSPRRRR